MATNMAAHAFSYCHIFMSSKTRKDVAAECWHHMRPSIQRLGSGADSKLGLTMVRPGLQSAPDSPVLDMPFASKHYASFQRFLTRGDFDLWPFIWKLGLHLLVPWRKFTPILTFLYFFELQAYMEKTDRQMDRGQTDKGTVKTCNAAYKTAKE